MNEIVLLGIVILTFALVMLIYRLFGYIGLYVWVPIAIIAANIQALKIVELFGLTTALGNVAYGSLFLVTDILAENYGARSARRAVMLGLCSIIAFTLLMNAILLLPPAADDFAQIHLRTIFGLLPRIVGASLCAYIISQFHDIWAYSRWRTKAPNALWLRNNASTLVSQIIDTLIFCLLAYSGLFAFAEIAQIMLTNLAFKAIVALVDTPLLYLATRWKRLGITS